MLMMLYTESDEVPTSLMSPMRPYLMMLTAHSYRVRQYKKFCVLNDDRKNAKATKV